MSKPDNGLRWHVGNIRVTSIVEQDLRWRLEPFLPGATPEVVAAHSWLEPFVDKEPGWFSLRIQAFVVETPGARIIVDTCVGNHKERGFRDFDLWSTPFLETLTAAGFSPESIDTVLCTHLHIDHVGWNTKLVNGEWEPTFTKARYLFCTAEYDHWSDATDAMTVKVMADSVSPIVDAGLADFVELDHHVCEGVDLIPTVGHTPGHVSIVITSQGESAVITGDMAHHPVQIAVPSLCSMADSDPTVAAATRRERFGEWCGSGTLVIGTHFAPPTAGYLTADGDSWRLGS